MTIEQICETLIPLASERTKKRYMSQGAQEPLFGMTIKALKPLAKKLMTLKNCQAISYDLYATGNYDLMYLAGMIVNPHEMSKDKFEEWIDQATFYMESDYIVAVCLSETDFAEALADTWIASAHDLKRSAGYSTYGWLLASQKDTRFDHEKLSLMLDQVSNEIHTAPNRTRYAMNQFVYNVGVSYLPLHEKALAVAKDIGQVTVFDVKGKAQTYHVKDSIEQEKARGRLGFKRKYVRC